MIIIYLMLLKTILDEVIFVAIKNLQYFGVIFGFFVKKKHNFTNVSSWLFRFLWKSGTNIFVVPIHIYNVSCLLQILESRWCFWHKNRNNPEEISFGKGYLHTKFLKKYGRYLESKGKTFRYRHYYWLTRWMNYASYANPSDALL